MRIEYSPDEQLLYLQLQSGTIAETVELEPEIFLDIDRVGEPLGLEVLQAGELFPFLARLATDAEARTILDLPKGLIAAIKRSRQMAVA